MKKRDQIPQVMAHVRTIYRDGRPDRVIGAYSWDDAGMKAAMAWNDGVLNVVIEGVKL